MVRFPSFRGNNRLLLQVRCFEATVTSIPAVHVSCPWSAVICALLFTGLVILCLFTYLYRNLLRGSAVYRLIRALLSQLRCFCVASSAIPWSWVHSAIYSTSTSVVVVICDCCDGWPHSCQYYDHTSTRYYFHSATATLYCN